MIFRNYDINFDIFDADDAEGYEAAANIVQEMATTKPAGETLTGAIRRQCTAIFDFFDTILGEDIRREIFGDRVNLCECIDAFSEFCAAIVEQRKALDDKVAKLTAEIHTAQPSNRAARRAQARAAKRPDDR